MSLIRNLVVIALLCFGQAFGASVANKTTIVVGDPTATDILTRGSAGGILPELSDWLIAPNTRWCGRGNTAGRYNHLGGASTADKCCRKHDHCQLNIPGLQRKWDLFNYRPYTLSHCSCDMRFRMCLKMAKTPDSQLVGKLFFNFVQTQCFVIKKERVCQQRAANGTGVCEKHVVKRKAYLRDNKKF